MSKINFSSDKYFKAANLLNELFKKSCAIRSTISYLQSIYGRIKSCTFLPIFCRFCIHVSIGNIFDQFFGQKSANILTIVLSGVFSQWFGFWGSKDYFSNTFSFASNIIAEFVYYCNYFYAKKKLFLRRYLACLSFLISHSFIFKRKVIG